MEAGAVSSGWRPSRGAAARQTAAGRAPRPLLLPRCSPMAAAGRRFGADAAPSQPRPLLAAAWPQQQLAAQHAARCAAGSCGGSSGRGARAGGRCTPHRSRVRVAAAFEAEATTTSGSSSGGGGAAGLAPPGNEQQQQQQQSGSEARDGGSAGASSTGGSGAKDVRSFDLHLPPSSSGSTGLEELDDVELRQQAQVGLRNVRACGYTAAGRRPIRRAGPLFWAPCARAARAPPHRPPPRGASRGRRRHASTPNAPLAAPAGLGV